VKVNVCNTILLIFTPNPCSTPLNTNSMSLQANIYKNNCFVKYIWKYLSHDRGEMIKNCLFLV
jgi:hypothetical protein